MSKNTFILPNAGIAVFKRNGEWRKIDSGNLREVKPIHSFDLNILLLSNSETIELNDSVSPEEIRKVLQTETKKQRVLTKALQLMDKSLADEEINKAIAEYLEKALEDDEVSEFVRNRLFSLPVSSKFAPVFAVETAEKSGFDKVKELFSELNAKSNYIGQFRVCWNKAVGRREFGKNTVSPSDFYNRMADKGLIYEFASCIEEQDRFDWKITTYEALELLKSDNAVYKDVFDETEKELKKTYGIILKNRDLSSVSSSGVDKEFIVYIERKPVSPVFV